MTTAAPEPVRDQTRCWWCLGDAGYVAYHDTEWGRPERDDRALFEKISLEGFQAGLSWLTILRKRPHFRHAFANFDVQAVARFGEPDVARLLGDARIVRHRGKIEAVVHNAKRIAQVMDRHGSLAAFVWQFEPDPATRPAHLDKATLCTMPTSRESTALSKELRRLDFKFVGPTTCYAFMQAMGLVNDHVAGCAVRDEVEQLRTRFARPGSLALRPEDLSAQRA